MLLISVLLTVLFSIICYCVGVPKGYSAALCILAGLFGGFIALIILALLPDRTYEETFAQSESAHKRELDAMKQRIADLEAAQTPVKAPEPPISAAVPENNDAPILFPARTSAVITCPRCGRRQAGNRNACYSCQIPFQYELE